MENNPLEIEFKYLIRFPDTKVLSVQPEYRCRELTQIYLELPEGLDKNGTRCRIRRVCENKVCTYYKTFKTTVTDLTRIEIESEITKSEYEGLRIYARKNRFPIQKTRHSFAMNGLEYEIDIYPFWCDRAILEVEVKNESEVPPIPPFISIIKDVTANKLYRNSNLCTSAILDPID